MLYFFFACESLEPTWIDQAPACAAEPYDWSDDLVSYVKSGPGDGSFDLDPAGDPRERVEGAYAPSEGSFAYDVTYGEDYWVESEAVTDGTGTAWHNGDLDVQYVATTTDRLGETWSTGMRVQREACAQSWWTWNADADEPVYQAFSGTWAADLFEWEADYPDGTWTGSIEPDSRQVVDFEIDGEDEHFVYEPDGTSFREFELAIDAYTYEGEERTEWNGDFTRAYKIREKGDTVCSVDESFDYDGDGTAHYECGGDEYDCEYNVKDSGACTYECDNGEQGSC